MGKVAGVRTGIRLASSERAGDRRRRRPLRPRGAAARRATCSTSTTWCARRTTSAALPWHARWDTARTLLNRCLGRDYPGTLAVRRSRMLATGLYDGDVLFENLELIRTVRAARRQHGRLAARPLRRPGAALGRALLGPAHPPGLRRLRPAAADGALAGRRCRCWRCGALPRQPVGKAPPPPGFGGRCAGASRWPSGAPPRRRRGRLPGLLVAAGAGLGPRARRLRLAGRPPAPALRRRPLRRLGDPRRRPLRAGASASAERPPGSLGQLGRALGAGDSLLRRGADPLQQPVAFQSGADLGDLRARARRLCSLGVRLRGSSLLHSVPVGGKANTPRLSAETGFDRLSVGNSGAQGRRRWNKLVFNTSGEPPCACTSWHARPPSSEACAIDAPRVAGGMPDNDPQTQLVKYLTDVHSIEEQALVQMRRAPDLVEGALAEAFRRHLGETESQEQRVRERLEAHDASPSKLKDVAGQAGGFGMVLFARSQPDTPGKLAMHAFSYEHMEVAAYELLGIAAREAGDEETAAMAAAIADEEREMAGRIADGWDEAVEQALAQGRAGRPRRSAEHLPRRRSTRWRASRRSCWRKARRWTCPRPCAPPWPTTSRRPKGTCGRSSAASTTAAPPPRRSRTPRCGSALSTGASSSPPSPTPRPSSPASPTRSRTSRSPPTSCCCASPVAPATARPSPSPKSILAEEKSAAQAVADQWPVSMAQSRHAGRPGRCSWRPAALAGGGQVQVFDLLALAVGPLGEGVEVEAVEGLAEALLQRVPELHLAADPRGEDLQLEDPAERRVAAQLAVQLQPAEPLAEPCERRFDRVALDSEPAHQPDQRLAVGFDLGADPRQRLARTRGRRGCSTAGGGPARRRARPPPDGR